MPKNLLCLSTYNIASLAFTIIILKLIPNMISHY